MVVYIVIFYIVILVCAFFFFFKDTATTEIYTYLHTLSLHDALPIFTRPDIRWGRCDIKTVGLLPAALAKQAAKEAGAYEAWLVDRDGFVTEGSRSEERTSELQSLMRISYAVFCLKKKTNDSPLQLIKYQ